VRGWEGTGGSGFLAPPRSMVSTLAARDEPHERDRQLQLLAGRHRGEDRWLGLEDAH
jgi:hypothetical protein